MKKLIFLMIICFTFCAHAHKQNIIAIVNDEPITKYEFDSRKKLAIVMFNIDTSHPAINKQLNIDIMNSLIEGEVLKQHAETVGGEVSDKEINETIAMLEKQNKMPKGQLLKYLKSRGVNIDSFRDQLTVEKIKMNIVQSLSGGVKVSQSEFEDALVINSDKDLEIEATVFSSKESDKVAYNNMKKLKTKLSCNHNTTADFADNQEIKQNLKDFDGRMQSMIKDTREKSASSVFKEDGKFKVVLVCKKQPMNLSEQDSGRMKYFLSNKKVTKKAEKFLADLKEKAYIKIIEQNK